MELHNGQECPLPGHSCEEFPSRRQKIYTIKKAPILLQAVLAVQTM